MDFYCTNTSHGLVPNYADDYEEKRKLKIGEVYKVKVTKARNYQFLRKYFALINCAFSYLDERQTAFFKENVELFRKTVEIAAGNCELVYSIARKEWIEMPKSISFDKMDDAEFQELYERVKDVIFLTFLKHIDEDEFLNNLSNF